MPKERAPPGLPAPGQELEPAASSKKKKKKRKDSDATGEKKRPKFCPNLSKNGNRWDSRIFGSL